MSELINRTKALEAIRAIDDHGDPDRANALGLAEWAVKGLPSEQTEIARCKDCYYCAAEKSFGKTHYYCDAFSYHAEGDLIGVSLQVSPEHFCGWAERRADGRSN